MKNSPLVMIGCPVRDRDWILPLYLHYLLKLNYEKNRIVLCFILNDSTDSTEVILKDFAREYGSLYMKVLLLKYNTGAPKDARSSSVRKYIYKNLSDIRNQLLLQAREWGVDYLYSVDSDIMLLPDSLNKLIDSNKPIISAFIWNDVTKTAPNIMKIKVDNEGFLVFDHYLDYPTDSLFECDVTGAVYLLNKEVVRKVRYHYHVQGEDIGFCVDAKLQGFSIWCDSSIQCSHILSLEQARSFERDEKINSLSTNN